MSKLQHDVQSLIDYCIAEEPRAIMVLSHDTQFGIAHACGRLIHTDKADFQWFRKITNGRVGVVGRKTYEEVKDLKNRTWVRLSRSSYSGAVYNSDCLKNGVTFAREIARSKGLNRTVVIAGGAEIYNHAVDCGIPDIIFATVWDADLDGAKSVNDYTLSGLYRLYTTVPLAVEGSIAAQIKMYVRND